MATATARIVVLATSQDNKAIAAKARRLNLSVSELMRRGALAYEPEEEALAMLVDLNAADRSPYLRIISEIRPTEALSHDTVA